MDKYSKIKIMAGAKMLKLQYFGHLMQRTDSLEKTPMLRKIEGRRRRGWQRMKQLDGITSSRDMSLSKLERQSRTGKPGVLQSMGSQSQTQLSNWTELWFITLNKFHMYNIMFLFCVHTACSGHHHLECYWLLWHWKRQLVLIFWELFVTVLK